jgi:predicted  nucleic acid-binding Zn-ribbon protein
MVRMRDALIAQLDRGLNDLDNLRKAIADIRQQCLEKEHHISQLESQLNLVERDLGAAEQ